MMTWDIKPGLEDKYFVFITQEFPNALRESGLRLTDAWYTVYGDWPQVRMGFLSENLLFLEIFLNSAAWLMLKEKLQGYILDYKQKIVAARAGFQM